MAENHTREHTTDLKKLLIYLKDSKKETVLAPLFKMTEAIFELLVPLVVASVIDVGIKNADRGYVVSMCLLLAALGAAGLILAVTAQYFAAKASAVFSKNVRHALFAHLQSLSFSEIDTIGTSTMINRLTSDVNQMQTGVNLFLRLLLRSPFVVFGAMIMAFTVNVRAAMVFVIAIPLLFAAVFAIILRSLPLYRDVQTELDGVLGKTRENLSGTRVIRAFCKEAEEESEFRSKNKALTRLQNRVGRISALLNPSTYVMINLAVICLIWTGALQVNAGSLSQGEVVALYNYMSQILVELIKMANLVITLTRSVASAGRVSAVLEVKSGLEETLEEPQEKDTDTAVEFDNVGLRYEGDSENTLSGISLRVKKGETVGVIGGTGSGKTSLVNLVPRFYEATEGEVRVDGINVKDYPIKSLRMKIGVVPQNAVLFAGTVRDNIKWGSENATDEEIYKALEAAAAKDIFGAKDGLDYVIEQGGRNLSGGQRQRLTVARALVRKPEILLLDDSSSALDYATDAAMRRAIRELDYSPTVFIVSQRTSSIRNADKIVVLDDGRIVGIGTHDALLESCPIYGEIHNSQIKAES